MFFLIGINGILRNLSGRGEGIAVLEYESTIKSTPLICICQYVTSKIDLIRSPLIDPTFAQITFQRDSFKTKSQSKQRFTV